MQKQSTSLDKLGNTLQEILEKHIPEDEACIGQFQGYTQPSLVLYLLLGSFSTFMTKHYIVTVTDKNIYFSKKNIWSGKIDITDTFGYEEIESFRAKTGMYSSDMEFKFKNGNKLKLKATYRKVRPEPSNAKQTSIGIGIFKLNFAIKTSNAILDEPLINYLRSRI